ncbi:ATP-binding cassette domain-containing protein [Senegalia massiliensis]|uniref:ATP-binding cassette domain-containing protein n=1 Tax=Senegalia massiliensis TaxID=1720316 RepID=UPI0010308943|nr:ATP-binding cassette domain-containing protein [Senegalia massiliensis]
MNGEILRIENVSRKIDGITYLNNINFNIRKGEILGLLPLDNHGKEQLIELIIKNLNIDYGRVYFDEKLVNYYEYSDMQYNEVYVIDKNTKLISGLKVIDNIYVLNNTLNQFIINENILRKKAKSIFEHFDLDINPDKYISDLSKFEKVVVEVIKAVINGAKLIILNELSNFLSINELYNFQKLIKYYSKKDISFLYMANHHEEAFKICNRVCLLEDGKIVKVIEKNDYSDEIMLPYIVEFDSNTNSNISDNENTIIGFEDFTTTNVYKLNIRINKGECITILDKDNKGIQDIVEFLKGNLTLIDGNIIFNRKTIKSIRNLNSLIENEILFIPENPIDNFLFFNMSYLENLMFLLEQKLNNNISFRKKIKILKEKYKILEDVDIDENDISNLSKKSLYDLIYFKVYEFKPKLVFLMQPFSGADMYLRARIIQLINKLKNEGITIIILAVSLSDTLTVSDRLITIKDDSIF